MRQCQFGKNQPDPSTNGWKFTERGGINLYVFVGNGPVTTTDRLGLSGWRFHDPFGRPLPYDPRQPDETDAVVLTVLVMMLSPFDETLLVCKCGQWTINSVRAYRVNKAIRKVKLTGDAARNVSRYHKGNLDKGSGKDLYVTETKESSECYARDGDIHKFEIPENKYREWENQGLVQPFKDTDLPSGGIQIPDAVVIRPPASDVVKDKYKKELGKKCCPTKNN